MSITLVLIAITVVISYMAFKNDQMFHKWMMNPYIVSKNREYFRFVSSGFIHADYMHLGFNMFTFYFFGHNVESFLESIFNQKGKLIFIAFYLLAIIVSEIPSFLKHRENPNYNTLGASGGVSAILFASILVYPTETLLIYGIIPIPGFLLGILYLVYSYFMGKKSKDNINHDAHLFGALFGIIFVLILDPSVFTSFIEQISNYKLGSIL